LSDIYGRKKMVVIILIIYIIGISAGGLSTNISFLLIARVIQGIGISNYTDTLTVDYISDGKNLNTTFWLASGFKNSSAANFNQPFRKITYGMLIDADSNTRTGYNGADYDFYVESMAGKLSAYLYQLSSTGGYRLVGSKINYTQPFMDPSVLLGSVHLQLGLGSINYPSKYNVMFYSAESFKSNEVRQFTSWVNIPPPSLQITTSPSNILIRQGEEQLIPARIKSTSGFSSDVINMTAGTNNNDTGSGFNSSELHVAVERIQPPLFKIDIPQQTPLGIYTIPLIVTIREPSAATLTKPISINAIEGKVDPEFELSKKYPTVGYLTRPLNLTITVMAPMTIGEQFRDFWGTYGQFIGLFAGGVRWSICESAV
ncbi:MAG TPA: MFS transporter, partial [Candidatus Nitrosopolaris sp.]|nr:MFS transporter [Candidatus Nitrosopolaris sp.]